MYDPTLKSLIDQAPEDWARWLASLMDFDAGEAELISTNTATFNIDCDRVFKFSKPYEFVVNLELESSRPEKRPERFLKYSVLIGERTNLPVLTVVVLLREAAMSSDMTGVFQAKNPNGTYLEFRYHVIKLWELQPETFLNAGLGILPLAPLAAADGQIPEVIRQMETKLAHADLETRKNLFAATKILLGLRFEDKIASELIRGVTNLEESSVYQAIIKKGEAKGKAEGKAEERVEATRLMLLTAATAFFGEPNAWQKNELEKIEDPERFVRMIKVFTKRTSWDELLQVI